MYESCRLDQLINETLFIGGNHGYWGCFNQEDNFPRVVEVLNPRRDFSIKTNKINQHKTQMAITKILCGTLETDVITLDIGETKFIVFKWNMFTSQHNWKEQGNQWGWWKNDSQWNCNDCNAFMIRIPIWYLDLITSHVIGVVGKLVNIRKVVLNITYTKSTSGHTLKGNVVY